MKALFTLFLCLAFQVSFGQTTPSQMSAKFFESYKAGDTDTALDFLYANSSSSPQLRIDTKLQLKRQAALAGKFYGKETLVIRSAGSNVLMYTYLVKHHLTPLVFRIMYYKANDTWQMHTFAFHNNLFEELEDGSKAKRFKENTHLGL